MRAKLDNITILRMCGIVLSGCWLISPVQGHAQDQQCIECHREQSPGIVSQWESSKHAEHEVTCIACHTAEEVDVDGFEHYGERISVIVSPNDCSVCHETEVNQQKGSHHAMAAEILGSLDNLLGEVMGGQPAVDTGCRQCHGSEVQVDTTGRPTADTWPNTGMGRINPDGSRGSCSACHARHSFSVEQARQPEACGKCHMGPDHPQIEIWNESKHGVLYHANRETMNLDSEEWVAGKDYFTGPTCSSCHMGAGGTEGVTHDVGQRISWTLRPPVSDKLNMVVYEDFSKEDLLGEKLEMPAVGENRQSKSGEAKKVESVLTWQDRRDKMGQLCTQCHAQSFVDNHYAQYDNLVDLYNEKFARPTQAIMQELKDDGIISRADFDDPIEWTWFELWHHEGRRARHGASMMGPDYTWWHGMYEVAKHFYTEFVPQLKEVAGEQRADALLEKYIYSQEGHLWHRDGINPELRQRIKDFYQQRYKQ